MYVGTDKVKNIYVGTDKIKSVYIGTEKVYSSAPPNLDFAMKYDSNETLNSDDCLTYIEGAQGWTPVRRRNAETPTACDAGSWAYNNDGTSSNPILNACFYATFQESDGRYVPYEKLNPNNLKQAIAMWDDTEKKWETIEPATSHNTTMDTFFCIPRLYFKTVSSPNKEVHMSTVSTYGGQALYHTRNGVNYQYVGLGVYPAYVVSGQTKSMSGYRSSYTEAYGTYTLYANASYSNGAKTILTWNSWMLYRMLILMAGRHFNVQKAIGVGFLNNDGAQSYTGYMDALGPWAGTNNETANATNGVKALIENPWGHVWWFVAGFGYDNWLYSPDTFAGVWDSNNTAYPWSHPDGLPSPQYILTGSRSNSKHLFDSSGYAKTISLDLACWGYGTTKLGTGEGPAIDIQYMPRATYKYGVVGGDPSGNAGISAIQGVENDSRDALKKGSRLVVYFNL